MRLALCLLLPLASHAAIGDWESWTYTRAAVMTATEDGRRIWAATSGGAVSWDADSWKSRVYTNLDGLSGTALRGIAIDEEGSVWATTATGHLCRKLAGQDSWTLQGSYASSNWTFAERAIATHRGIVVVAGPRGLSFYSPRERRALDNVERFGDLGPQAVSSIFLDGDTVWVGLKDGIARATPSADWKNLGKPGHLLADPARWTVITKTRGIDLDTIVSTEDSTFMARGPVSAIWKDASGTLRFSGDAGPASVLTTAEGPAISPGSLPDPVFQWAGRRFDKVQLAVHAARFDPGRLAVATRNGVYLVAADGEAIQMPEPRGLPVELVHHATFDASGNPIIWGQTSSPNDLLPSSGVYRLDLKSGAWTWLAGNGSPSYPLEKDDPQEQRARLTPTLLQGPSGELLVGTWGGGILSNPTGDSSGRTSEIWWDTRNSCLPSASIGINYPAVLSADRGIAGTWFAMEPVNDKSSIVFLPAGGKTAPRCIEYTPAKANVWTALDIASVGDTTIWVAILSRGLARFDLGAPSTWPQQMVPAANIIPPRNAAQKISRIVWSNGRLYFSGSGEIGYLQDATLISSLDSNLQVSYKQDYHALALDGLGNMWVAGREGVEIAQPMDANGEPSLSPLGRLDESDGLLSNFIYGLDVHPASGRVAIATDRGLSLYQSAFRSSEAYASASNARVYPNPVLLSRHSRVVFDGIPEGGRILIHTEDGQLVASLGAESWAGGQIQWNPQGKGLRPGVFLWTLRAGSDRKQGHLLIAN